MKVPVDEFLKGQRKAGFGAAASKHLEAAAIEAKEPTEKEKEEGTFKTFVLSPTGGEIHRGESSVDRLSKPETLREKIARFDRLAQRVREDRMLAFHMMQDSIPDGEDDIDDFDFEDGEIIDDFGDKITIPKEPVTEPVEPKSEPETDPVAEPAADPVAEPAADPEEAE